MGLTDWKNLPNTETPVNAENLKNDSEYLDNKIKETDTEDFFDKVIFDIGNPAHAIFKKVKNTIIIVYQGPGINASNGTLLFTLPEGYRPSIYLYPPFVANANAYGNLMINSSNGNVSINMINSSTTGVRIYFTITYTID